MTDKESELGINHFPIVDVRFYLSLAVYQITNHRTTMKNISPNRDEYGTTNRRDKLIDHGPKLV